MRGNRGRYKDEGEKTKRSSLCVTTCPPSKDDIYIGFEVCSCLTAFRYSKTTVPMKLAAPGDGGDGRRRDERLGSENKMDNITRYQIEA